MWTRRQFVGAAVLTLTGSRKYPWQEEAHDTGQVMTVNGWLPARELGTTLSHEHVLVDFIGANDVNRNRYDPVQVKQKMLPYLQDLAATGCKGFVDCTPAYLGRDVALLKALVAESQLKVITNTGIYGAAKEKYIPAFAYDETAGQLANRWILEWEKGVEGTGIRPGFIKLGVDNAPLSTVQEKLIRAAAKTHLATGLTIAIHTGNGAAASRQLDILRQEGVAPAARIWVHAQNEQDASLHIAAARKDGWVSFDGVSAASMQWMYDRLILLRKENLLHRVLLSQDAGWYHVGEPGGGKVTPYDFIFRSFLPGLRQLGFTASDIKQLMETNPAAAFTIAVRSLD